MAETLPAASNEAADAADLTPPDFWRPLRYFSLYRLLVAAFFVAVAKLAGDALELGAHSPSLFLWGSTAYLVVAILLLTAEVYGPRMFNVQLSMQVATDVVALTILMHASGGSQSGVAVLIFVVLAGAGLVGQGRLTLFYAALATLAMLAEHAYRVLQFGGDAGAFFRVGLTSIGFFGTAISARLLGRRVIAQEHIARQRGVALREQLRVSERVIRDMADGVLIVDADGRVRQHNPQAAILLDTAAANGRYLTALSSPLSEHYQAWRGGNAEAPRVLRSPRTGRPLRTRFLALSDGGQTVVYLEDMGRIEEQARQLKLAALGRLTANMAHEIRNPLSAINHAAELLLEESSNDIERRLSRIIGDNAQRLNRLVVEVMELGRRDRASPEPLSLRSVLAQFVEELAVVDPTAKPRVVVTVETDRPVCFDRAHLHRVLWNLASNALRHATAAPGAVRIEERLAPETGESARRVELHIIDDGPGIAAALRGQVFEPFFTTHGAGTGLGLYIARELCDANGALLELLDNAGGAHFLITFSGDPWQAHATPAET